MLARGWNAAAGRAPLYTTIAATNFSFNSSGRAPTRFFKRSEIHLSYYRSCSSGLDSDGRKNGGIKSSDLVEREYADLNLKELYGEGEVGHVRIRQHVNPLSSSFSVPAEAPDWDDLFNDSKLPLMVDIGSGSGRFLIWLAKRFPDSRNYLGLEIRHKLVQRCQFWVNELSLRNIRFLSCNATISFEGLVSSYPGPLVFVTILCPDPHFKKRHHKRRITQKPLVDSILNNLITGGRVLLQSDLLQVALGMKDQFDIRADVLKHIDDLCDEDGWLQFNPIGIRTEREIHAEFEGGKIYRRMYQKL